MLLFEEMAGRISTFLKTACLLSVLGIAQACTVTPLYGSRLQAPESAMSARLGEIAIKPAVNRQEQQVRNNLIFLLGGGAAAPANPAYSLELGVNTRTLSAGTQQAVFDPKNNQGQPTSGTVVMTSNYVLTDSATGEKVASGKRSASADFDQPREEFANDRAERDAQDRAARELAELLRLSIAQDLAGK
jgi:LPS-assembly lipoprotein